MLLHVLHPAIAGRSCEDCRKWIYDDTGDGMGTKRVRRGVNFVARPEGSPTPCWKCPKKSPAEAKQIELSPRNLQALRFYFEVRGTRGQSLVEDMRRDAWILKNMALIEYLLWSVEREEGNVGALLPLLLAGAPPSGRKHR